MSELRKLIRFYWEKEINKMQEAFTAQVARKKEEAEPDDFSTEPPQEAQSELLTTEEAAEAFREIEITDAQGNTPVIAVTGDEEAAFIDVNAFVHAGIAFKKALRESFRQNGGYTPAELEEMHAFFQEYDEDNSDSIGTDELGNLIRDLFPVMTESIRPKLDQLMKEVDAFGPGTGQLSFSDFVLTMREFHDIQAQERLNREQLLVAESGFSAEDVHGFRELFVASDTDNDMELSIREVKGMIDNVCPIGERGMAELMAMFQEVQDEAQKAHPDFESSGNVDFPEFLLLMRKLLTANLGGIAGKLELYNQERRASLPLVEVTQVVWEE